MTWSSLAGTYLIFLDNDNIRVDEQSISLNTYLWTVTLAWSSVMQRCELESYNDDHGDDIARAFRPCSK